MQIKCIEDELKELDRKKIFCENKIEEIKKQVEHYKDNLIDFHKMKENLSFIARSIDMFEPKVKKNILRLFIEHVLYYKEKIRISLRDLTSGGLSFSAEPSLWFDKIQQWLPEQNRHKLSQLPCRILFMPVRGKIFSAHKTHLTKERI